METEEQTQVHDYLGIKRQYALLNRTGNKLFFHPLAPVVDGFQNRPHCFSTIHYTQTWLYNNHFMAGYLPTGWLSWSTLHTLRVAAILQQEFPLCLLSLYNKRGGVQGRMRGWTCQGRLTGNYFPPCIAATSLLAFSTLKTLKFFHM